MYRVLDGISRHNRIASAYLFVGPPQSNKLDAALEFAEKLGCKKIDLLPIKPDGASLKIEQVREIQAAVRYGPAAGAYQFVIIEGADSLTPEAAGAFLKTLEEPPPKVVFVLLVEREDRVLPTINSRCQKIIFCEAEAGWRPNPEYNAYYEGLKAASRKSILELFSFSSQLEKEKDRLEALLYDLVFYAKNELGNLAIVKALLEGIKNLKKKANVKLTLDVLCLKLGEL